MSEASGSYWRGDATRVADGVTVARDRGRICVRMWGEHDRSNADLLRGALVDALAADGLDVVVDMAGVTFMDGSAVGSLIDCRCRLTRGDRDLTVHSPAPSQRRMLEVCGLAQLIEHSPEDRTPQGRSAAPRLEAWVDVPASAPAQEVLPPIETAAPHETGSADADSKRAGS